MRRSPGWRERSAWVACSRASDPGDARAPLLKLTPLGWEVLGLIEPARRQWADAMDGVLSVQNWRTTLESLSRLAAHLEHRPTATASGGTNP